jgi:hypothetical protein
MKKEITRVISLLSILLLVYCQNPLYSAIRVSAQSGNFYNQNTWVGGFYPAYGDDIVISSGHMVTLDADAFVLNITIEAGATLDNGIYNLKIINLYVWNPIYSNNGVHNGTGNLVAYEYYDTEMTGNGITNCNIEIVSYGLRILNTCNLTINGNVQHSANTSWDMNGKYFIDNSQGGTITINGDLITTPLYAVGIQNALGTLNVNGNVFLYGASLWGAGSTLDNQATLNISGNLLLGDNYGYAWNHSNGMINIGGDLLGSGAGVTYFIQDPNSTVRFGGSVFPASSDGELCVSGPGAEPNIVEYNGNNNQVIKAPSDGADIGMGHILNTYSNLVINNSSFGGVNLNSAITVNGTLTLANGLVNLESHNLILGQTSDITGTPTVTNMIVATGSGELRKTFTSTGSFTFPVGDNQGTAEYTPITLNFTSGTFANAYAGVNLVNAAYSGSSGSYLERYWNITSSGITSFLCDARFDYVLADIIGAEHDIYCYRVAPTTDLYDAANTTLHQMTASDLTSFGTFTGRQQPGANMTLYMKAYLQGFYLADGTLQRAKGNTDGSLAGEYYMFTGTDANVADTLMVLLAEDVAPDYNYVYKVTGVKLHVNGDMSVPIPPAYFTGNYYIVLKHRNHLETWSSSTVNFSGTNPVSYDFTDVQSKAFGLNLTNKTSPSSTTVWALYGGDIYGPGIVRPQDGNIESADLNPIYNKNITFRYGYLFEDLTGDSYVSSADLNIVYNNNVKFVSVKTPRTGGKSFR